MIESLKKTRADFERACDRHDAEEMTRLSGKLCAMLVQEIMMAFGGIGTTDMCVIVAACKLAISVVEDSAEKAGLTAEEVFGVADNLATLANRHTTRLTIVKPMHKGAGNDD